MASTSKMPSTSEDDLEEEFEHFDDFTLASSWERFISEIEAVCRKWLADGTKNLLKKDAICLNISEGLYKADLKYEMKSYCMEYYFGTVNDVVPGKGNDWSCVLHDLQLFFGVNEFLVIAPQSASGVVLDGPEASKLLSAVAIALSNCSSLWPAFVPVHDPSRKAYIGIQNMGTLFTRRFEADRIGSQVPVKLMHLEGLYELFVSKFAFSTEDLSTHLFEVSFKMKLTYCTLPYDEDDDVQEPEAGSTESGGSPKSNHHNKSQWDDDCPWSEWYSSEDPVRGFELIAVWSEKAFESSLDMAELENASPLEADDWLISPCLSETLTEDSDGKRIGFASQLRLLVDALEMSMEAKFIEDFVSEHSGPETVKSSAVIPPPTVLDRVLKDLFHEVEGLQLGFSDGDHKDSRTIKGAPLESLFGQFCLHALWFGDCNIRAIAIFWIEFVREVRWCWEESQPVPRMPSNCVIDLSTCLINQKLHMLSICINKKRQQEQESPKGGEQSFFPAHVKEETQVKRCLSPHDGKTQTSSGERERRGSAGVVGSMMLLESQQNMHAPFTQEPPVMTEDMHEERLQAVEALGDSFSFSAQLEKDILSSDMSAFKAANPDAVFEDFIRWHSPRDWENNDNMDSGGSHDNAIKGLTVEWPPRGKLSERMSEFGNSWRKIWNEAPPLPASEQKPLLDPNREGEKVLHYLETLRPCQLLEQMVCTAFRAAADTLNRTTFGGLKQLTTKIGQLNLTMAATLRCLQTSNLSIDTEDIQDLKRLCEIFEHVEKLITLAASLYTKFMNAPRLLESIFNDCYNFYAPRMGTVSTASEVKKDFEKKQKVGRREREIVASMFTTPTANQSWRKVLSLGNLLNGHEPTLREIIFTKHGHLSENYYGGHAPRGYQHELETYRMYISGTSNDLSVALAVASCD
ncbi:PREDICTED: rab3 GTPase-activating protein catalytic subunit isoform X3 [Nicotiana attenuata]|uniref:rab3 GTPase-activating protein catalytic subunit isoform X3 n=1 Tax=Nicotiana attenuata TaxID=49451 RepID=UPI0009049810|nr:PREDICTED: rab3 GTPase-activating protein catalytic subunit isoform X3 [Nicotiana attenuata]